MRNEEKDVLQVIFYLTGFLFVLAVIYMVIKNL